MENISLIIADGQYLIRVGLRAMLSTTSGVQILAEAKNESELLEKLAGTQTDVVILDYNQAEKFNLNTIKTIKSRFPKTEILVISADDNKQTIYQALGNGARSFLSKECDQAEIIEAIKSTAQGKKFYCRKVLDFIFEKSFTEKEGNYKPMPLSNREIEIVQLIAKGLIAKEIAAKLNLSTHTIYTHRKNITKKLNISSTSELVLFAVKMGIVGGE